MIPRHTNSYENRTQSPITVYVFQNKCVKYKNNISKVCLVSLSFFRAQYFLL